MNTSNNDSVRPLSGTARKVISERAPTNTLQDSPRSAEMSAWLSRISDGHLRMSQNDAARQAVAKKRW